MEALEKINNLGILREDRVSVDDKEKLVNELLQESFKDDVPEEVKGSVRLKLVEEGAG